MESNEIEMCADLVIEEAEESNEILEISSQLLGSVAGGVRCMGLIHIQK